MSKEVHLVKKTTKKCKEIIDMNVWVVRWKVAQGRAFGTPIKLYFFI